MLLTAADLDVGMNDGSMPTGRKGMVRGAYQRMNMGLLVRLERDG